jgi:hypothetical protein
MARFMTTAMLAAMIGLGTPEISAPASAGGITLMVTPDGESADIIQQGLRIYSIVQEQKEKKKRKNHARVEAATMQQA